MRYISFVTILLLLACGDDDAVMDASTARDGGGDAVLPSDGGGRDSGGRDGSIADSGSADAPRPDGAVADAGSDARAMDGGSARDVGLSDVGVRPFDECDLYLEDGTLPLTRSSNPGYLDPIIDPVFGTRVTRISGDPGSAIGSLGANWDGRSRHGYSKRQPWNADESMLLISTQSHDVILDGQDYTPLFLLRPPVSFNESRWHPVEPDLRIFVDDNSVGQWNVRTGEVTTLAEFPGYSDLHMGPWEGNLSLDGHRIAVLGENSGGAQVAFGFDLMTDTKSTDVVLSGIDVDWVSISPLGGYLVVNGWNDETQVYDWSGDPVSGRWTEYGRPSHYDLTVNGDGDEVAVGVSKSDPDDGRVIARRLRDGAVTVLTPGGYATHTSTRNRNRPGYAYVTYNYRGDDWLPYRDEVIAVPVDGSMRVERLAHLHSHTFDYWGQSQAVPSPSGRRVLFASDWDGSERPVRAYVVDIAPLCD